MQRIPQSGEKVGDPGGRDVYSFVLKGQVFQGLSVVTGTHSEGD